MKFIFSPVGLEYDKICIKYVCIDRGNRNAQHQAF